ncbi:MAG TPA: 1-acyl-sn-glycerol-3-phosphate acyltransferase, partial [Gammaproteobacteria bacterium]|nr:1-acyl-sn-glycerol-3-phosphate acyltransferase [Gammaproteobacteria bacterium]
MIYIRSLSFYLVYVASAVLAGLIGCFVGPFLNLRLRLKMLSIWPRFSNWVLYKTCNIRIKVEGEENIPKGPFVIVSNHQGQWETFFYQYFFLAHSSTSFDFCADESVMLNGVPTRR